MTAIAYNKGRRIIWGFNIEVTPWTHDGKCDLIVDSIALPPQQVKRLSEDTEKKLLVISAEIQKLQAKAQRIVNKAYPSASQWKQVQQP